jgi:hypothetical protein
MHGAIRYSPPLKHLTFFCQLVFSFLARVLFSNQIGTPWSKKENDPTDHPKPAL